MSANPDPRLDEIQARVDAATPGPWANYGNLGHEVYAVNAHEDEEPGYIAEVVHREPDAHFISNAPTDVQYLLAELRKAHEALERVEALHKRVEGYQFGAIPGAEPDWPVCSTCFTEDEHPQPWPCPTAAAVAAAKGDE